MFRCWISLMATLGPNDRSWSCLLKLKAYVHTYRKALFNVQFLISHAKCTTQLGILATFKLTFCQEDQTVRTFVWCHNIVPVISTLIGFDPNRSWHNAVKEGLFLEIPLGNEQHTEGLPCAHSPLPTPILHNLFQFYPYTKNVGRLWHKYLMHYVRNQVSFLIFVIFLWVINPY